MPQPQADEPHPDAAPFRVECAEWAALASALPPGSVDLVYADPPFNTGRPRRGRAGRFEDAWATTDDFVRWLRARIAATLPALKPTGSLLLHLDGRAVHYAKVMLDGLMGESCFLNHLVWAYGLGGSGPRRFARKHDDILWYAAAPGRHYFDPPRVRATSVRLAGRTKKATDVLDIPSINNMARERCGYPTQKPLALLDLLVRACCPPGGVVLDPCCGSGTTLVAAAAAGRRAIGGDTSPEAIRITRARLLAAHAEPPRPERPPRARALAPGPAAARAANPRGDGERPRPRR